MLSLALKKKRLAWVSHNLFCSLLVFPLTSEISKGCFVTVCT